MLQEALHATGCEVPRAELEGPVQVRLELPVAQPFLWGVEASSDSAILGTHRAV